MNIDQMPEFRKPQLLKRVEDLVYHAKSEATSQIFGAYSEGFGDGQSYERRTLIDKLREYEKDSVVATLLAQMLALEVRE